MSKHKKKQAVFEQLGKFLQEIREMVAMGECIEPGDGGVKEFSETVKAKIGAANSHLDGAKSMIKRMRGL